MFRIKKGKKENSTGLLVEGAAFAYFDFTEQTKTVCACV